MASATASKTFQFKSTYKMANHDSSENGVNWPDGQIVYREYAVVNEAVAGFTHIYAYGFSKFTYLAGLTGRPHHNL